jgi:hypothetical protein
MLGSLPPPLISTYSKSLRSHVIPSSNINLLPMGFASTSPVQWHTKHAFGCSVSACLIVACLGL